MAKSVWYSYVGGAEAVGALEDLGDGEEGHGGLTIVGHGVAITDHIMGLTIARGVMDLDPAGGAMVPLGEDRIGEVRMEVITTMCRMRPMVPILDTATETRIQ
jgi:hypothetical protein